MKSLTTGTKELLGLGFISLLGLATLFIITGMMQTTGNFVYAGGKIQLDITEACNQVTNCQTGPAVFADFLGWKANQHPGQYAICVCPEDVTQWNKNQPIEYDKSKARIISFIQNYKGEQNEQ